jgi:hypothetical protein
MGIIEGLRNGQELGALLGYQLERGLHEGHEGRELDAYIWILRERFPFVSKRLSDVPDGTPAEAIEARNVVDGHALVAALREDENLLTSIPGLPRSGPDAEALRAEIDALDATLDALSDLSLAESVHQVVQGNMARAQGVLQAASEGDLPPVPEFARTPRSGRLVLERLLLHLPESGTHWGAPSPRAEAEPGLDRWLTERLPSPDRIGAMVLVDGAPAQAVTLADLGLCAIDIVLLTGDTLGLGTSELERALADTARVAAGVDDDWRFSYAAPGRPRPDAKVVLDLGQPPPTGAFALVAVFPVLAALRRLLSKARALTAEDWRLPSARKQADPANPKGYHVTGSPPELSLLAQRIAMVHARFAAQVTALRDLLDDPANTARAANLRADPGSFDASEWAAPLLALRSALRQLVPFAIPGAIPATANAVSSQAALGLLDQAAGVLTHASRRLADADAALELATASPPAGSATSTIIGGRLAALAAAAQHLVGAAFPVIAEVELTPEDADGAAAAIAAPAEADALRIETYLQSLARVRPVFADLARVVGAAVPLGVREPRLVGLQLPSAAGVSWAGLTLDPALARGEVVSILAIDGPGAAAGLLRGLALDEWSELVPEPRETTAVAFHFDRPNASAPNALLLAVPPEITGRWTWNAILAVITDTLDRARERAIEPSHIITTDYAQIVPMVLLAMSRPETKA